MVTQACYPPPHTVEAEARDHDEFEASFELLSCLADLKGRENRGDQPEGYLFSPGVSKLQIDVSANLTVK